MKRILGIASTFALCVAATTMGQNLISNPGFENSGSSWTLWTQGGSQAVASVTYPTTGARTGTRYARVVVSTAAASASENWHVQFQPASWAAGIGATYEFKFWAKSDSSANIHVSVQGSDFAYLAGTSFGLTNEWTEYSLTHLSDAEGTGAVRFHIYVAESVNTYSFDDVSVTALTANIRGTGPAKSDEFKVRQERGSLELSLARGTSENWTAELVDLRGTSLAVATGRADGALRLALPRESGAYVVRAKSGTKAWVRKISVP